MKIFHNIDSISKLKSLEKLDLRQLKIYHMSNWFIKLKNLKELNMYNHVSPKFTQIAQNRIKIIKNICTCLLLEKLDLSSNYIQLLPEEIGNLTSLIEFTFENNEIGSFPVSICNLKSLKKLNIGGNYSLFRFFEHSEKHKIWLKTIIDKGCEITPKRHAKGIKRFINQMHNKG